VLYSISAALFMHQRPDKNKKEKKSANSSGLGASLLDGENTQQQQTDVASLLDENTERPVIQKRLKQEIADYQQAAVPGCNSTLNEINACYEKTGCNRPIENPTLEQCKSIPSYPSEGFSLSLTKTPRPGEVCYNDDAECRAVKAEAREEKRNHAAQIKQQQSEWSANYETLSNECKQRATERETFAACQKQYDATCNPNNINSVEDCINLQVKTNGPTEKDARKSMQKEWQQRSKTGSSITNSILD
jgi:hypothetical protein